MDFSKRNLDVFFEIPKNSKNDVQCHWKSKTPQNVQNLILLNKINVFFGMKVWFFWKTAQGSKFTVECNWISKISRNVQNLASFWEKLFSRKKCWVF